MLPPYMGKSAGLAKRMCPAEMAESGAGNPVSLTVSAPAAISHAAPEAIWPSWCFITHNRTAKKPVRRPFRAPGSNTRTRTMFAVIRTGGKQYRVAAEDVIKVDKVKGEPGEIVQFGEVLVVGGDNVDARRARPLPAPRSPPRCWSRAAAPRSSPSRSAAARIRAASAATGRNSRWCGDRDPDRRGEADQDRASAAKPQSARPERKPSRRSQGRKAGMSRGYAPAGNAGQRPRSSG